MILLVCGGRTNSPRMRDLVRATLREMHERNKITGLVTGDASGVDSYAKEWAYDAGVDCVVGVAYWSAGPSAGPRRNAAMLRICRIDRVVAFPGGRGTANCVGQARSMGIPVSEIPQPTKDQP